MQQKVDGGDFYFAGTFFPEDLNLCGRELQDANFQEAEFAATANFHKTKFSGSASFFAARFNRAHFNEAEFGEEATFHEANFRAEASFREAKFVSKTSFLSAQFQSHADYFESTFESESNFASVKFGGGAFFTQARFSEVSNFQFAEFSGEARFHSCRFLGKANFFWARFGGDADYSWANFAHFADFSRTDFACDAKFGWANFGGAAYFSGAKLGGSSDFRWTQFFSTADFFETRFLGKVYFAPYRLSGLLNFHSAQFADAVSLSYGPPPAPFLPRPLEVRAQENSPGSEQPIQKEITHEGVRQSGSTPDRGSATTTSPWQGNPPIVCFENVLLERAERARFENFNLACTTFAGTNLRGIRFHNPRWPRHGRRIFLYDELRQNPAEAETLRLLYRDLKANLEDARDWVPAGAFYYAEMEVRRKARRGPQDDFWWLRRFLSPYTLYWAIVGYGERPLWAAIAFLVFALLFAGIHTRQEFAFQKVVAVQTAPGDQRWVKEWQQPRSPSYFQAFGHSLRSLTLQRAAYLEPHSTWAHRTTLMQNILGPVQLTLLGIALRRRFRR